MPYTPLHIGPGMLLKAMTPRHFSVTSFGIAQVLIDLEVLWNMAHHSKQLHTFMHTYLGASLAVLIAIPLGKTISAWVRRLWNFAARHVRRSNMSVSGRGTWAATIFGASVGAYSHVLFDSFYHSDIEPFQPWSALNPCKGILDPFTMETVFNALFIVGLVWFVIGYRCSRRRHRVRVR